MLKYLDMLYFLFPDMLQVGPRLEYMHACVCVEE